MSHPKLTLALAAALFALPLVATAQENPADETDLAAEEEESIFSWNAALTSDYVFRGVSQTDENPALQLGADLNFDNGFYVGIWGSNVDFGAGGPDIEVDTYIGWNADLSDAMNFDLMLTRYNYLGADDDYGDGDYNELIGTLTWNEMIGFTAAYTNDVWGLDEDGFYYAVNGSWEVGNGFALDAGVGRSLFDDDTGVEDYTDWSLALSRDFGMVNIALGYYGTDSNGEWNFGDTGDDRLVLTFSIGG